MDIDPLIDPEGTLIPPMILQPFVENSILHGLRTKENGLIKIKISRENVMLPIVCIILMLTNPFPKALPALLNFLKSIA